MFTLQILATSVKTSFSNQSPPQPRGKLAKWNLSRLNQSNTDNKISIFKRKNVFKSFFFGPMAKISCEIIGYNA